MIEITKEQYWIFRGLVLQSRVESSKLDMLQEMIIEALGLKDDDNMYILDAAYEREQDPDVFLKKLGFVCLEKEGVTE